jgi:hypothetical protein
MSKYSDSLSQVVAAVVARFGRKEAADILVAVRLYDSGDPSLEEALTFDQQAKRILMESARQIDEMEHFLGEVDADADDLCCPGCDGGLHQ